MRVAHLPAGYGREAASYVGLLSAALREQGVEVLGDLSLEDCVARTPALDVVHLHWIEYVVSLERGRADGLARSLIRGGRFVRCLIRLRRRGVRIVWTIHNLRPHEPRQPAIERLLTVATLRLSDAAITHSEYARSRLLRAYPGARRITVIPHGNYVDAYPDYAASRLEPRPDGPFEFLCFGQIRPYKQLPELVRAFRAIPEPGVRLVIAGKPIVAEEMERIRAATGNDPRVVLDDRMIPVEEVSALHRRADAAIFAYRDVFSSGALLLALSYGLPVVAPAVSTATELVHAPGLETFDEGGLTAALQRVQDGDQPARREAALSGARAHPWSEVAEATVGLYRQVAEARGRVVR